MKRKRWLWTLPLTLAAFLVVLGTADGRVVSAQTAPTVPTSTLEPSSPTSTDAVPGSASEIQDYGRRQSLTPGLSEFAGGHDEEVIIIGGCGCMLAVLVILLVLL